MTTPTDKDLRALAEAATSGPWRLDSEVHPKAINDPKQVRFFDETHQAWSNLVYCHWSAKDAAFIAAANPQTVIGLLDRIEAAEATIGFWAGQASYDEGAVNREVELSKKNAELSATRSQLEEAKAALTVCKVAMQDFGSACSQHCVLETMDPWFSEEIEVAEKALRRAKAGGTDA